MNDYRYNQLDRGVPPAYGFGGVLAADASVAARMAFVRKVYVLFLGGIFCAMAGVAVSIVTGLYMAVVQYYWLALILLIGAVIGVGAVRRVKGVNLMALFAFTFLEGVLISPIILFTLGRSPLTLLAAGALTVATFGADGLHLCDPQGFQLPGWLSVHGADCDSGGFAHRDFRWFEHLFTGDFFGGGAAVCGLCAV